MRESAVARGLGLLRVVAFVTLVAGTSAAGADTQPNIILMVADDQGWDGLSVPMSPEISGASSRLFQTPRLEAFAAQGMRFSSAYAAAPVCSPSRISIQCGRSPAALHWTKAAPAETGHPLLEPRIIKSIPSESVTIGELLREAGYATAHYGKWHIGGGGPGSHGYDAHDGDTGNEQAFAFTDPNPVDIVGMANRTEAFMRQAQAAEKPFFVQLSWNALHAPENALEKTKAKYAALATAGENGKRVAVAAITEDLDSGVGMVLDAVDRLGLAATTYVIYTSDNGAGGGSRRGALSGGKGSLWEGGIRVPFIVRGPGVAANSWCHLPVVGWDLLPTFCEWAGVPRDRVPRLVEGGSMAGLLANGGKGEVERAREGLVFHFPHYQNGHTPHAAIRVGNLKLIEFFEDQATKLFDLESDPGERVDLANNRPADAARLQKCLELHLAAVDAQFPTQNPDPQPDSQVPERPRGGRNTKMDAKTPRKPR
ncbi:MAG: DUF4976 domain-containing protein [Planctomycetota bacterium]|nr:MAG: DUF4976 domain-containing protein [Planctomycetota bacterium]